MYSQRDALRIRRRIQRENPNSLEFHRPIFMKPKTIPLLDDKCWNSIVDSAISTQSGKMQNMMRNKPSRTSMLNESILFTDNFDRARSQIPSSSCTFESNSAHIFEKRLLCCRTMTSSHSATKSNLNNSALEDGTVTTFDRSFLDVEVNQLRLEDSCSDKRASSSTLPQLGTPYDSQSAGLDFEEAFENTIRMQKRNFSASSFFDVSDAQKTATAAPTSFVSDSERALKSNKIYEAFFTKNDPPFERKQSNRPYVESLLNKRSPYFRDSSANLNPKPNESDEPSCEKENRETARVPENFVQIADNLFAHPDYSSAMYRMAAAEMISFSSSSRNSGEHQFRSLRKRSRLGMDRKQCSKIADNLPKTSSNRSEVVNRMKSVTELCQEAGLRRTRKRKNTVICGVDFKKHREPSQSPPLPSPYTRSSKTPKPMNSNDIEDVIITVSRPSKPMSPESKMLRK